MGYEYEEKKTSKIALIVLLVLAVITIVAAATRTVDRFNEPPKENLTAALNIPYPPFEDKIGNEFYGFDVSLVYLIGEKTNKNVIITDFPDFGMVLPSLEAGASDVAISAISITEERKKVVDFSIPYYNASQAVLVLKNSNKFKASGTLDAKDFSGIKVGYQEKTTSQEWVDVNLIGKIDIAGNKTFGDLSTGLQLLRFGDISQQDSVDAVILDEPSAISFAETYPDLKVAGTIAGTSSSYGIAVKKGDPQHLLEDINRIIEETKKDGKYDELIQKHFGGGRR